MYVDILLIHCRSLQLFMAAEAAPQHPKTFSDNMLCLQPI
jgi:hypothetical protein